VKDTACAELQAPSGYVTFRFALDWLIAESRVAQDTVKRLEEATRREETGKNHRRMLSYLQYRLSGDFESVPETLDRDSRFLSTWQHLNHVVTTALSHSSS